MLLSSYIEVINKTIEREGDLHDISEMILKENGDVLLKINGIWVETGDDEYLIAKGNKIVPIEDIYNKGGN